MMRTFGPGTDRTLAVAVADMNGDGALDIIAGNDGRQSVVYLSDGQGSLALTDLGERSTRYSPTQPMNIALGDFDARNGLDLVVLNRRGEKAPQKAPPAAMLSISTTAQGIFRLRPRCRLGRRTRCRAAWRSGISTATTRSTWRSVMRVAEIWSI